MKQSILCLSLLSLIMLVTAISVIPYSFALGSFGITIEEAEGGYTDPSVGIYSYPAQEDNLEVTAYPYPGYYFAGWILDGVLWETAYNPIEMSLNVGESNVWTILKPYFITNPIYILTLSSDDNVWVHVNDVSYQALTGGTPVNVYGGTSVEIFFPDSLYYPFGSYLVNGTTTITDRTYTFTMNGDTTVYLNETYTPLGPGENWVRVDLQSSTGGTTDPYEGVYYYRSQVNNLLIWAYPNPSYFFVGWVLDGEYWNTTENPLQMSLNVYTNVSIIIAPAFSTNPTYTLTLYSADNVYIDVNHKGELAYSGGKGVSIRGGSTVTLSWPISEYYSFVSYTINGTLIIKTSTYSFVMNGDTSVFVGEFYSPPGTGTPTGDILGLLTSFLPSGIIVGALGVGFSRIGEKLGEHQMAGFFIGGSIGLIICANSGLVPIWVVTAIFTCGMVAIYFWFRSN